MQIALQEILHGLDTLVYIDDIFVASYDIDSHFVTLRKVFGRLRIDKCSFASL